MRKIILILLFGLAIAVSPAWAQEVFVRFGDTQETGTTGSHSYAYGFSYLQGLGENLAWSIGYLNEGHVPDHKRDGLGFQLWGRTNVLSRRLSLAVGVGPYLYWDTALGRERHIFSDEHGVGAMFSVSATLYTKSRFLVQGRVNYILTSNSINTLTATIGLGFQLEKPPTPGPLTGSSPAVEQTLKNEVTFFGGRSITNAGHNDATHAESLQYRRNLTRHFD